MKTPATSAIVAACLFGVSVPLSKRFLAHVDPVPMASLLYLGSGLGLLLVRFAQGMVSKGATREAGLKKRDLPWLSSYAGYSSPARTQGMMIILGEDVLNVDLTLERRCNSEAGLWKSFLPDSGAVTGDPLDVLKRRRNGRPKKRMPHG